MYCTLPLIPTCLATNELFQGRKPGGKFRGGGRWHTDCFRVQTSYSQNWPYVETSDTVEDKNKNVYIITVQLKLSIYAPYFFLGGGHDVLPSTRSTFWG